MKHMLSMSGLSRTGQPGWRPFVGSAIGLALCLMSFSAGSIAAAQDKNGGEGDAKWKSLFDGESLEKWEPTSFGGEGEVRVEDGVIVLEAGVSLTGIHWKGDIPKANYEIELESQQLQGIDFFCGLTFPVNESHCSFIVGGWAGSVVGLSNIDGLDASQNETTKYMKFEKEKWYRVRVRVESDRIRCWIDDEQVVDQDIKDRKIDLRPEVIPSKPLGIAAWQTKAGLRKIRIRDLPQ